MLDAAFHSLALVPLPAPANLSNPLYKAWALDALSPRAVEPLVTDSTLLASLARRAPTEALKLQLLPWAWSSPSDFLSAARTPISQSDEPAREALRSLSETSPELCELMRCALALCLPTYVSMHPTVVSPDTLSAVSGTRRAIASLGVVVPSMNDIDVVLCNALGGHGRVYRETIYVGVAEGWCTLGADDIAQQCLHEHAVAQAVKRVGRGPEAWAKTESLAVRAVDRLLENTVFYAARERWKARHDLTFIDTEDPGDKAVSSALCEVLSRARMSR